MFPIAGLMGQNIKDTRETHLDLLEGLLAQDKFQEHAKKCEYELKDHMSNITEKCGPILQPQGSINSNLTPQVSNTTSCCESLSQISKDCRCFVTIIFEIMSALSPDQEFASVNDNNAIGIQVLRLALNKTTNTPLTGACATEVINPNCTAIRLSLNLTQSLSNPNLSQPSPSIGSESSPPIMPTPSTPSTDIKDIQDAREITLHDIDKSLGHGFAMLVQSCVNEIGKASSVTEKCGPILQQQSSVKNTTVCCESLSGISKECRCLVTIMPKEISSILRQYGFKSSNETMDVLTLALSNTTNTPLTGTCSDQVINPNCTDINSSQLLRLSFFSISRLPFHVEASRSGLDSSLSSSIKVMLMTKEQALELKL